MFFSVSCNSRKLKIDIVVFPEYCGACVAKNFQAIVNDEVENCFVLYLDTTDQFLKDLAKLYNLEFIHISNYNIQHKFGDYANIVLYPPKQKPIELKTNEIIERGKHY